MYRNNCKLIKDNRVKIAYQGIEGSNSEEAAQLLALALKLENVEYVPLINSKNVVSALKAKEVDYGVMATKNTLSGRVEETHNALLNENFEVLGTHELRISHFLFVKDKDVNINMITEVVSHVQALSQCKESLAKYFPHMRAVEIEDTAIGARRLAEGTISDNTAVLCRKNAGELFNLHLVKENLQDSLENFTEFKLYKLPN